MLSHDLFEGDLARAALVSDIEVVEDFPARHDIAARRQHRWVRGDWQLLPWLTGLQRARGAVRAWAVEGHRQSAPLADRAAGAGGTWGGMAAAPARRRDLDCA
jgi:cyclic beta-1,2-glucan synthetase